jgi:hypothetical protein
VEQASECIEEGYTRLGDWSEPALAQLGGRKAWREKLLVEVADRPRLIRAVREQIVVHKLGKLPAADLEADVS